jgi:hypothetical protein
MTTWFGRALLVLLILQWASICAAADRKPGAARRFNVDCPAKDVLPKLDLEYHRCNHGRRKSCELFVSLLRQVLPASDCQRPFDRDQVVPALWLADAAAEDYVRLLSRLTSPEARRLFASDEFRRVLDGALAEEFGPVSRHVQELLSIDHECPDASTGMVTGVVRSPDGVARDVDVRFHMSDDATVSVKTDADGMFSISCVYPAAYYSVCIGPETSEQCFPITEPEVLFPTLMLH